MQPSPLARTTQLNNTGYKCKPLLASLLWYILSLDTQSLSNIRLIMVKKY